MNPYDHEDAFKAANLHAGAVVNLPEAVKWAKDHDLALCIINDARKTYSDLFDAFIAGVDYGRKNPLEKSE